MMNPLASRLALLLAVEGVDRGVCLSLAAKALPPDSRSEGLDREVVLCLAAKAPHSDPRS